MRYWHKVIAILALVAGVSITDSVSSHSTGSFHYHSGTHWFAQMKGTPMNPINGRFGVNAWIYINPSSNPLGTDSDTSGWLGIDTNGAGMFRIHVGHGRNASNQQDLFTEIFAPPGVQSTCFNPEGGGGFGTVVCYSSNYAYYGVPTEGWYQVAVGDANVDGRWQTEIHIQGILFARIDWDGYGGISGQHQTAEAQNGQGLSLDSLYGMGMRWGSSFFGFNVATGTNGVGGPWEMVPRGVTLESEIKDVFNTSSGRVGCGPADPGGDGRVVQAAHWYSLSNTSHAHGSSPPIGGGCYFSGTSFP
jgi:hypothetical protein